ncbi:HNH endonuclease [uncultured Pelagibacterium sp.]|uniref:HNH endonuclease n=1 Tax=uncultured Pelagibacterium sp. TaxID=1159875 RepID=UPI0030DB4C32|tara:strand:+ start:1192 stop:2028 length:837 start_codon:yes stop_codon:yes gene_type:complete
MILQRPQDIFTISIGDTVTKRNLFDLIQYSKIEESEFWGGPEFSIGNTPQQGINWIGAPPLVHGVIIKARHGSYEHDGWADQGWNAYRYSFKARNSVVSYHETANRVLISQPQYSYPILLFTEQKAEWVFEGQFAVTEIADLYVFLERQGRSTTVATAPDEITFREGGRRYATHLLAERSRSRIEFLKTTSSSTCDICDEEFATRYGVSYIEAHHKVPISTFTSAYTAKPDDLALLCPNCHKAVHIYMKQNDSTYAEIKDMLQSRIHQLRSTDTATLT